MELWVDIVGWIEVESVREGGQRGEGGTGEVN